MISRYITNTNEITDTYKKILLNTKDAKVKIEPSNDNGTKLVFFENKKHPYEFFIEDDTLTIKLVKTRWYNLLRVGIDRSEIRLYVPKSTLETISVRSNTGHVDISSIICNGAIDIQINTGNINLENVSCQSFNSKGNTGCISLNQLTATESVSIKRGTGKVSLNDSSAPEFFIKTNTGSVGGRLLSNTVFTVRTNTGKIKIPKPPVGGAIGGRCEIKTNTGNINFE